MSQNLITNPTKPSGTTSTGCTSTISLLEGGQDQLFFNRLLSRDSSSKGFSSRIYYRVVVGKVPFEWEAQPGKPKIVMPEISAPLPPLSPPPAILISSTVAHRCPASTKGSTRSRLRFWKKIKVARAPKSQSQTVSEKSFESWSSCEGDSYSWSSSSSSPRNSSSSSLSSSFDSPVPAAAKQPAAPVEGKSSVEDLRKRTGMEGFVWVWSCTPWGLPGAMHG